MAESQSASNEARLSVACIYPDRLYLLLIVSQHRSKRQTSGACCNLGYPSETNLKLKSRDFSFVQNIQFSCQIILKFCSEHGSETDVLCAKFQNDLRTGQWVMSKRDFARFVLKMRFGRIPSIATIPWLIRENGRHIHNQHYAHISCFVVFCCG